MEIFHLLFSAQSPSHLAHLLAGKESEYTGVPKSVVHVGFRFTGNKFTVVEGRLAVLTHQAFFIRAASKSDTKGPTRKSFIEVSLITETRDHKLHLT